jgi:hypothetical protein
LVLDRKSGVGFLLGERDRERDLLRLCCMAAKERLLFGQRDPKADSFLMYFLFERKKNKKQKQNKVEKTKIDAVVIKTTT